MLSRQALLRSARAAAPSRAIASQARFYAAAPAANETVKPPVALFGLDGTYATALVRHRTRSVPATRDFSMHEKGEPIGRKGCAGRKPGTQ